MVLCISKVSSTRKCFPWVRSMYISVISRLIGSSFYVLWNSFDIGFFWPNVKMTILTMKTVPLIIYIIFQNSACSMFVLLYLFQEVTLVISTKFLIPIIIRWQKWISALIYHIMSSFKLSKPMELDQLASKFYVNMLDVKLFRWWWWCTPV